MTTTTKTTETKSIAAIFEEIERAAAGADAETRFVREMTIGDHVRQGDVYVIACERTTARGDLTADRQVAPGNTLGSRHVAEGDLTVYARKAGEKDVGFGPVIVARKEWRLTHPEHAHFVFPEGCYQIRYQIDERTRRAVQD